MTTPCRATTLAKAKNRFNQIPGVPWYQALAAHALIHAGMVTFITGSYWLGVVELVFHMRIDDSKCSGDLGDGELGFNQDQFFHVLCKAVWAFLAYTYVRRHLPLP